jgi:hypothetical protein
MLTFSDALVNFRLRRQLRQLLRCKLQHADIALLGCHMSLGDTDLLLRGYRTGLNLLEEL